MKRKREEPSTQYSWMDTYGDMVTLLLTFFVLLYSMSNVDSEKWKNLVEAFANHNQSLSGEFVPIATDNAQGTLSPVLPDKDKDITEVDQVVEFNDLYYYLKNYIESNNLQSDISIFNGNKYTFICFNNNIFFDGDSSVLRYQSKEILDIFAEPLKNIADKIGEIRAYGHTARSRDANVPNNQYEDRTLSVMRANNVILYLQVKNIIKPEKMVAEGYGEYRPILPHDGTEATRIKNRRVEIYISKSDNANITLEEIYKDINESKK